MATASGNGESDHEDVDNPRQLSEFGTLQLGQCHSQEVIQGNKNIAAGEQTIIGQDMIQIQTQINYFGVGHDEQESPRAMLDKINSILKNKLERNPELFKDAILTFCNGVVTMATDIQLSSALTDFGKHAGGCSEKKSEPEKEVKKWQQIMKITKRGKPDIKFHDASSVALHQSGDVAVMDTNWVPQRVGDPKSGIKRIPNSVYGFKADGTHNFTLASTHPQENPVGILEDATAIGVTQDGQYIVTNKKHPVKVFDINGEYVRSFSTSADADDQQTWPNCIAVRSNNGEILIGDSERVLVTVHISSDFSIVTEVHVSFPPQYIAANSQEYILVSNNGWNRYHPAKISAFDYLGDELFTIVPQMWGKEVRPQGIVCDTDDNILLAVVDGSCRGHVHQYNSKGDFKKCVMKGLRVELGHGSPMRMAMAMSGDTLAIVNGRCVQIYKSKI